MINLKILMLSFLSALFIFDESRQPIFSARNMNDCGYSEFAKLIIESGHLFTVNNTPLKELLPILSDREDYVLILLPVNYNPPDEVEEDLLEKFVRKGGKLLLIGEHFNEEVRLGKFSSAVGKIFGYEFENWDCIKTPAKPNPDNAELFSPFFHIRNIPSACAGILKKYPPGKVILKPEKGGTPPDAVAGHCVNYGRGKVCVLTDPEMFLNDFRLSSVSHPATRKFTLSLINYLGGEGKATIRENFCFYDSLSGITVNTMDVFSISSSMPSGFSSFLKMLNFSLKRSTRLCKVDKVLIFLSPFSPEISLLKEAWRKGARVLIALDRNEAIPPKMEKFMPPPQNPAVSKFTNFIHTLNTLCGANFIGGVLVSPSHPLYLIVEGKFGRHRVRFWGSGGFSPSQDIVESLIRFSSPIFLETAPLNAVLDLASPALYNPEDDIANPVGGIKCGKILAFGDTDFITNYSVNEGYNRELINYILSFLK